jgi:hypothetical protein
MSTADQKLLSHTSQFIPITLAASHTIHMLLAMRGMGMGESIDNVSRKSMQASFYLLIFICMIII